jgi:hypothetical protein
MGLGFTQPLTEMNMPGIFLGGGECGRSVRLATSTPFVTQLPRKCGILDIITIPESSRPPQPVTGIAVFKKI